MNIVILLFLLQVLQAITVTKTKTVTHHKTKTITKCSKHTSRVTTKKSTSHSSTKKHKSKHTSKSTTHTTKHSTAKSTVVSSTTSSTTPSTTSSSSPTGVAQQKAGMTCGYNGTVLDVTPDIHICLPQVMCNPETCPPTDGTCVNDVCVYNSGYSGLATYPHAWATYYCTLGSGGCQGVTQMEPVETTAKKIATLFGTSLCSTPKDGCVGISAAPPMMVGNSQNAPIVPWGLGYSEASKVCYNITGPSGYAIVALTDRCGGYCKCGVMPNVAECGPCVSDQGLTPNPPCISNGPQSSAQECDWCAGNSHPHFDLDTDTFDFVCGQVGVQAGSCEFSKVEIVACDLGVKWDGETSLVTSNTFDCKGVSPSLAEPLAGNGLCCIWGAIPINTGGCQ